MQIKEVENSGLKRGYQIIVPVVDIEGEMEKELRAAGKQAKIPGFRPGFVPMKILKQRYGDSVKGNVLNDLIKRGTIKTLQDNKLKPATTPDVKIEVFEDGKDLVYAMAVEIFPEVPELSFSEIKLKRDVFTVDEQEIDKELIAIAENSPNINPLEDGAIAAIGNIVEIDFKGMVDGKEFAGGAATDYQLELGSNRFIDNFEEQLVGTKAGDDKIVTVKFPDNYGSKELAGKDASFAVKIKRVLGKTIPEINDELAVRLGVENLGKLRDIIHENIKKSGDNIVRSRLKKQLFDSLENIVNFDLPEGMVKAEFDNIWKNLKKAQEEGDETLKSKSDADLEKEYRPIAKRRVKLGILLADVSSRNQLQVNKEELTRAAWQQAMMFRGQEREVMDFYKKNPDRLEDLRGPILEEKAVDFILGKISYEDKAISLEELRKDSND